jgi:hypothetical protein
VSDQEPHHKLQASQAEGDSPICRYCRHPAASESLSCPLCGAAVDIRVTSSGWMEQPVIQSMTRIRCGNTRCQIAGTLTPMAEFDLAPDDWVYFAPHALLWADTATTLEVAPVPSSYDPAARRGHDPRPADLPRSLLEGHGPGHIGVSENRAGELSAVPLAKGQSVHILENQFLCATGSVSYRYLRCPIHYRKYSRGGEHECEYPSGRYHYRFTASGGPGLLLLHAAGNVFVRDLTETESILVQSGSPVYGKRASRFPCTWSTCAPRTFAIGATPAATGRSGSGSAARAGFPCSPVTNGRRKPDQSREE